MSSDKTTWHATVFYLKSYNNLLSQLYIHRHDLQITCTCDRRKSSKWAKLVHNNVIQWETQIRFKDLNQILETQIRFTNPNRILEKLKSDLGFEIGFGEFCKSDFGSGVKIPNQISRSPKSNPPRSAWALDAAPQGREGKK